MASDEAASARDDRADYDYTGGDVARPGLVDDLESLVDGAVRFDEYTRQLYATDASAYEVTPVGVVYPRDTADVAAVVEYCADREIPVLPRGGGTSLAGQAVNEAVVLDFTRHMDDLLDVDPEAGVARAQPGAVLGDINAELAEHGLKFAPDPAWGDKSALGGAIGNNSTGAHSLKYGKTDAYVEACEVVLADGTVTTFGETSVEALREAAGGDREAQGASDRSRGERSEPRDDLEASIYREVVRVIDEEADAVREAYPQLKRNVSGYNLDRLVEEAHEAQSAPERASGGAASASETVNLARLLAGSEGTLAVVTEATVSLEPVPATKAMALLAYDDLVTAMEDVAPILEYDPAAVEVLDDVLLGLARDTSEFGDLVAETVPDGTGAVLLVEFYADDDAEGRREVADLLADRGPEGVETEAEVRTDAEPPEDIQTAEPRRAFHADEAHEEAERERFWQLRKSGLPILLSRTTDEKHISFIEDTAIPPEHLPEYVEDVRAVLDAHDTHASFYAHAGPGVLHIRPLVNTKTPDGVAAMESIAHKITDLVVEYGGSVSGEHGDGRARTRWNRKLYGDHLWTVFRQLKSAFDPDWLLNPGQVCGDVDMTEHLRFSPDYEFESGFGPALNWENPNGMQGMVELCHGCGGCRGPQHTTGGVMCPTYRAADEEITSTRGRANALRQAMSGDLPADPTDEEFASEVLDLCIGCKGCANDCPSEVDLAKLKVEVEHARHRRHGASLRERLFANVDRASALGSALAPVSNWLPRLPGARRLLERTLGIARERTLPAYHRHTFADWMADRDPAVPAEDARRRALVLPDAFTNYSEPAVARAAVRVLEAADVHVRLAGEVTAEAADEGVDVGPTGRAAYSKGFLDRARVRAEHNVEGLAPCVEDGWDVVVVEPSDAVMVQSDYRDLLAGDGVDPVAANTYEVCEYLDAFRLDEEVAFDPPNEHLTYHGHCHQKATNRDHHAVGVLRRAGYEVDPLDSGCCGMAGSFGYEAEHYAMSRAVGRILFDQVAESPGDEVVAPGASCRTQLGDRDGHERPPHPVQKLTEALSDV